MCLKENRFGHNYLSGQCLGCGRMQEVLTFSKERIEKPKKEQTASQQLAEEIWLYFGKELKFGFLMGIIRNKGSEWVRRCWREVVADRPKEPIKVFKWKLKQAHMYEEKN